MKGFQTYFTFLERNKLFTFVNVAGLSISLMFVLLIANMVTRQLTIDKDLKDADRTYLFRSENYFGAHYHLGERLADRYPEIEAWSVAANSSGIGGEYADIEGKKYDVKILVARDNFFQFFGFPLSEGDPAHVLQDNNSVVITRSAAQRFLGNEEPIGKSVRMNFDSDHTYTITGVMEDIGNSIFPSETEMVFPFEVMKYINYAAAIENTHMQNFGGVNIFIRTPKGVDPNTKKSDMLAWLKTFAWPYRRGGYKEAVWVPMREVYFSEIECSGMNQYSHKMMITFVISGILILLMAVCNYVNMSVAQTSYRAKEMATRRLLGSSRRDIFLRMMAESVIMTFTAFVIAFLLAKAVEPTAAELLNTKLDLIGSLNWATISCYLSGVLLLSVSAGFIPATILSRYDPMDVVKGTFRRKTKSLYLRILYTVQCGLTVSLLACALFLSVQIYNILHEPLGYSYGNVICYPNMGTTANVQRFRNEAQKLPFVNHVSLTRGFPVDGGNGASTTYNLNGKEIPIDFRRFEADSAFLKIFHIPLEKDYHLPYGDDTFYLNHEAFRQLGLPEDANEFVAGEDGFWKITIAGRIPDFQVYSAIEPIRPVIFQLIPSDSIYYPWDIVVEVGNGDLPAYKNQLDALYSSCIEGVPFESKWYDQLITDVYADIIRMDKVIILFTCVALLISLLGLTTMSLYFITQRKRDMAIRKVFGSDNRKEMLRLISFIALSLLISLVIIIPAIYVGFSYIQRIILYDKSLPIWTAFIAFITIALISFISIILISRHAIHENPVNNLKTE